MDGSEHTDTRFHLHVPLQLINFLVLRSLKNEISFFYNMVCAFNPIQTALIFSFLRPGGGGGVLRRSYTCNCITAYGMATKFT